MAFSLEVNRNEEIVNRPLPNFQPSIWGNLFTSMSIDDQARERYAEEIKQLKGKVGDMFIGRKPIEMMNLINTLERLGVSYHFEEEIENQLEKMFNDHDVVAKFEDYDLFTTSLFFRIFRQHGYNLPCDVFQKFMNGEKQFKEALIKDPEGMLSLYEATHVRTHRDEVLDEAFAFTTTCLESMIDTLSPRLAKKVMHALIQALHKGVPRVEARHYISVYEEEPSMNDILLSFAKLDFNLLQMLHQEELSHLSRWWEELDLTSRLLYTRSRVVECYTFSVGCYFEPKYKIGRIILTKLGSLITIIDDTYDSYGTIEELQNFTEAIKRWDMEALYQLPDYMKILYAAILNTYKEIEMDLSKQGESYGVRYSIKALKKNMACYIIETKWLHAKFVPLFDDYIRNAIDTVGYILLGISSFMGMGEVATIQAFDWVQSMPKSIVASSLILRLMNDIMNQNEQERGHVATGLECYMNEYGVSREEATIALKEKIDKAWKDINEEGLKPTPVAMPLLLRFLNNARVANFLYKYANGFNDPKKVLKDDIIALFVEAIPI